MGTKDVAMGTIEITVLVENTARGRGITGEHGLAYWIETPAGKVLFDTGQGMVLEKNALACGKRLEELDSVVLSHGHYDHTGALQAVLGYAPGATVTFHPDALKRRYSRGADGSIPPVDEVYLTEGGLAASGARCIQNRNPIEIVQGLFASGEIPRETGYEDTGGDFYLDAKGSVEDPICDDQSLYFLSRDGLVLILGCAHAGVVNTMRRVMHLAGTSRVHAVIGGMHLLHAGPERMEKTIAEFRSMGLEMLAPCHCTGLAAVAAFWNAFPGKCVEAHAGKQFRFNVGC
jgi:7,8-dihydropterin-6-yl-methyl-4-(beta-D-ribofuranosyl)aminobenzene 5'-phosphate synthase